MNKEYKIRNEKVRRNAGVAAWESRIPIRDLKTADRNPQHPTKKQNFNSFLYNNRNVPQPSFGGQGGFSPYQTNRQLGLSADKLFNN